MEIDNDDNENMTQTQNQTQNQTQTQGDMDENDDANFKTGKHNVVTPYNSDSEDENDNNNDDNESESEASTGSNPNKSSNPKPIWDDDEEEDLITENTKWSNQTIHTARKRIQKSENLNGNEDSEEETTDLFASTIQNNSNKRIIKRAIVDDED